MEIIVFILYTSYFTGANIIILRDVSKKDFEVVHTEDAAVADFSTFYGGKQLDVAPASVKDGAVQNRRSFLRQFKNRQKPLRLAVDTTDRLRPAHSPYALICGRIHVPATGVWPVSPW